MKNDDIIVAADAGYVTDKKTDEFVPNNPLRRPKINYVKPIIALLVYILQFVGLLFIPYGKAWICVIVLVADSAVYFLFIAKRAIIWAVHVYQNKAPDEVRLRCTMEPSCSEYMILAVQKYGVFKGVYKGIHRLKRCGDESGIDYP